MIRHAAWFGLLLCLGILANPAPALAAPSSGLPGDSVYQLDLPLLDQDGKAMAFASLRGRPRLITMFYSSCPYMCPLIIDTARMTERELDEAQRVKLAVLMRIAMLSSLKGADVTGNLGFRCVRPATEKSQ